VNGHTGIVLILDGHRRFLFDYGKNIFRAPNNKVVIRKFHPKGTVFKELFANLNRHDLRFSGFLLRLLS